MKAWLLAALAAAVTGSVCAEPVPPSLPARAEPRVEAPEAPEARALDKEAEKKAALIEQKLAGAGADESDAEEPEVVPPEDAALSLTEREQRRLERQERRRARRAARRARRAAEGTGAGTVEHGAAVSMGKAQKMGDALKKTLADPGALGEALSGGGGAGGAGALANASGQLEGGSKSLPDPANPKTPADLLVAARSGFAGSFQKLGMKVGQDEAGKPLIVDGDGKPATEERLRTLSQTISSEPRILMKRPDLYKIVPEEKFSDLKKDYKAVGQLGAGPFTHVALQEERDFVWSRSCSKLAGGCNRYTAQSSYQKGQDVEPEDLRAFWNAQHEPAAEESAAIASRVDAAGVRGRLKSVLSAIRSAFDGNSTKGGAGGAAQPSAVALGAGWDFKPGEVAGYTGAPEKRLSAVGGAGKVQIASAVQAIPEKARLPALGASLVGVLGLLLLVRRRA